MKTITLRAENGIRLFPWTEHRVVCECGWQEKAEGERGAKNVAQNHNDRAHGGKYAIMVDQGVCGDEPTTN